MSSERVMESVIIADCGARTTRTFLVETVDQVYRLVAQGESPSTIEPPLDNLSAGVRDALAALEEASARRMVDRNRPILPQEETGNGADAFLATVAATPPLRLALLSAGSGPLVSALLDVVRRSPVTALPALTVEENGRVDDRVRDTVGTIARHQPNILLLVAGGNPERALRTLLRLADEIVTATVLAGVEEPPAILFVGDERWHETVTRGFGRGAEIGLVASGGADVGTLAAVIEQEVLDFATRRATATQPGFEDVAGWSMSPPLARSRAIELVNRFMAVHFGSEVLTVELEDGATICWANGSRHAALTEPALDLGLGAGNLLTTLTLAEVARWLPFTASEDDIARWILNRALRPYTVAVTERDRAIEAAVARELIRTGAAELRDAGVADLAPDLIVGGRFFAHWPDLAGAMLALIDGVQPHTARGLTQVALDLDGLLPAIGALGAVEPGRTAELFEHDGLVDLGACLAMTVRPGEQVRGQLEYASGESRPFTVTGGTLLRLPLPLGERAARLRIDPGGGAAVGRGAAGAGATFEGEDAPLGGVVGLVIDARGRPLDLPREEQERLARLGAWSAAMARTED